MRLRIRFVGGEWDGRAIGVALPLSKRFVRPAADQSTAIDGLTNYLSYRLDESTSPPKYRFWGRGYVAVLQSTGEQWFFKDDMPPIWSVGRFDAQNRMIAIDRYRWSGKVDSVGRGILDVAEPIESPTDEQKAIETARRRYWNYEPDEIFSNNVHLHKQVTIRDGGIRKAEVDEVMAPVILAVWRNEWETCSSCQEQPSTWVHGASAYITFAVASHRQQFVDKLRKAGIAYLEHNPENNNGFNVYFSPKDLNRVVTALN